jgi:hypothetical protein
MPRDHGRALAGVAGEPGGDVPDAILPQYLLRSGPYGTGRQDHSIREECESRDSDVLELMFRLLCTISLFRSLFLCVRGMVHFAQACPS